MNNLNNLINRVWGAWTNPGAVPSYHYEQVNRLKAEWPTLYYAIKALVEEWEARG